MGVSGPSFEMDGLVNGSRVLAAHSYQLHIYYYTTLNKCKSRASLLAPLSGGFIIDQMLKILVWDDFNQIIRSVVWC